MEETAGLAAIQQMMSGRLVIASDIGGIAEVVTNTLPRARKRAELHHLPGYYDLRNHIVDFLVHRSHT